MHANVYSFWGRLSQGQNQHGDKERLAFLSRIRVSNPNPDVAHTRRFDRFLRQITPFPRYCVVFNQSFGSYRYYGFRQLERPATSESRPDDHYAWLIHLLLVCLLSENIGQAGERPGSSICTVRAQSLTSLTSPSAIVNVAEETAHQQFFFSSSSYTEKARSE